MRNKENSLEFHHFDLVLDVLNAFELSSLHVLLIFKCFTTWIHGLEERKEEFLETIKFMKFWFESWIKWIFDAKDLEIDYTLMLVNEFACFGMSFAWTLA